MSTVDPILSGPPRGPGSPGGTDVIEGGFDSPFGGFEYYCTVRGVKVFRNIDTTFKDGEYKIGPGVDAEKKDAIKRYMILEGLIGGVEHLFLTD